MKPVLASWMVLSTTMILSFATYWTTKERSLVGNACNAASVLSTTAILVAVAIVTCLGGLELHFSAFQKWCLSLSAVIMVFWIVMVWGLKNKSVLPNILTQVLMVVGYIVTAERLWHATHNTEPMFTWICIALGGLTGMYPAIARRDKLALLYTVRTSVTTTTLLWLMFTAGGHH